LFLLLLSLLLLVFFVPFPALNEKIKPNKEEAKGYNPTLGALCVLSERPVPICKMANLPFSEVGWLSLISAVQNVSRFLQKQ